MAFQGKPKKDVVIAHLGQVVDMRSIKEDAHDIKEIASVFRRTVIESENRLNIFAGVTKNTNAQLSESSPSKESQRITECRDTLFYDATKRLNTQEIDSLVEKVAVKKIAELTL